MTIDASGVLDNAISDSCVNYDPNTDKPKGIRSRKGQLYNCFRYNVKSNPDQGCYWCHNQQQSNDPDVFLIYGWIGEMISTLGVNGTPHNTWMQMGGAARAKMLDAIKEAREQGIPEETMKDVFLVCANVTARGNDNA